MRLLVIEDDAGAGAALEKALKHSGHSCQRSRRGADALTKSRYHDLVMLDLGLPDIDGLSVLPRLRAISDIPVIVMTGRSTEDVVVHALRLGADDYLVKPLRLKEVLARIDMVMRRRRRIRNVDGVIEASDMVLDLQTRTVVRAGRTVPVTRTEFAILAILGENSGKAVSRESILNSVWGNTSFGASRSLNVHLTLLRAKLGEPHLITTIRGHGYRLDSLSPDAVLS